VVVRLGVRVSSQVREGDGEGRAEEKRNGPSHAVTRSHWWGPGQCTGATPARISSQIPVSGWYTSVEKLGCQEHFRSTVSPDGGCPVRSLGLQVLG
jgi:hypothetical protein